MRQRPEHRINDLIRAGTKVFLDRGYRRAQMADIAQAMGVAPGTVYLYVESKEALFDAVIRASASEDGLQDVVLPLKAPADNSTLTFIRDALLAESRIVSLETALAARKVRDVRVELCGIVRELFAKTSRRWLALKLLERSALDWPELAALWFGEHRLRILQQLTRYFEHRMGSGRLRAAPHPAAAARLVLEMIAAFAMHCRTDHSSVQINQAAAEATVIDAIENAYLPRIDKSQPSKKGHGKP
jgi:AcrR family transcriptional regulator